MNMLIGDPVFDNGGVGKLFFLEGNIEIPYRADPRWTRGVHIIPSNISISITVLSNPTKDIIPIVLTSDSWSDGILIVRDVLGRAIHTQTIFTRGENTHREKINLSNFPNGVYIIEFTQNHVVATARVVVTH
jgi:hypothetical protein